MQVEWCLMRASDNDEANERHQRQVAQPPIDASTHRSIDDSSCIYKRRCIDRLCGCV